jgi:CRP-like cAMP-binding protein
MQVTTQHLRDLVPLNDLDSSGLEQVLQYAEPLSFKRNQQIYPIDSDDGFVYYLLEGAVALADHNGREARLSADTKQARYAFGTLKPRPANARIISDAATVLRFNYRQLEQVVREARAAANNGNSFMVGDTTMGLSVEELSIDSGMAHDSAWFLAQMASVLFRRFPPDTLHGLWQRMETLSVKTGDVVVAEWAEPEAYYIIREGFCRTLRSGYLVAMHKPLETFGEYEIITGKNFEYRVEMLTDGTLMRLAKKDFDEVLKPRLLAPLTYTESRKKLKDGGVIVDIRDTEDYQKQRLVRSINIPLLKLKMQLARLDVNKTYILCSDDIDEAAVGAFILAQKGFDAFYLTEPEVAFDRILAG